MRVGSMFSGVGGIELGFHREGFSTAWFIERDSYAQAVLRKRFPGVPIYDDVTKVDFRSVSPVEIITGGFPCQPWSQAGRQRGTEDDRWLWGYCAEALRVLRPRFAIFENVPGLITGGGLHHVLADLAKIGYDAAWESVRAADVGAWHRRERVFILAYPDGGRYIHRESKEQSTENRKPPQREPISSGDVSYSSFTGLERKFPKERLTSRCGWWAAEPRLGRVANGVPHRMDRIKCMGNAVVPQVAQVFAKAIRTMIEEKTMVGKENGRN